MGIVGELGMTEGCSRVLCIPWLNEAAVEGWGGVGSEGGATRPSGPVRLLGFSAQQAPTPSSANELDPRADWGGSARGPADCHWGRLPA